MQGAATRSWSGRRLGDPPIAISLYPEIARTTDASPQSRLRSRDAAPGESFTLAISVFDLGDTVWDTVGIIDKFRWDCMGCVPNEVDSCGIIPQ